MVKEIPLTEGRVALVDDEDYERLSRYKWRLSTGHGRGPRYAVRKISRGGKCRERAMHLDILDPGPGLQVDHIDRNGLNNTRANLRPANCAQQQANSCRPRGISGYRGVHWGKEHKKWRAVIRVRGKNRFMGHFSDPAEAARVYDRAARETWGEFARLNFPGEAAVAP